MHISQSSKWVDKYGMSIPPKKQRKIMGAKKITLKQAQREYAKHFANRKTDQLERQLLHWAVEYYGVELPKKCVDWIANEMRVTRGKAQENYQAFCECNKQKILLARLIGENRATYEQNLPESALIEMINVSGATKEQVEAVYYNPWGGKQTKPKVCDRECCRPKEQEEEHHLPSIWDVD